MKRTVAALLLVLALFLFAGCGQSGGLYSEIPNYAGAGEQSAESAFQKDAAYVVFTGAEIEDVELYVNMLKVAGYEKIDDIASVYNYQKGDVLVQVRYDYSTKTIYISASRL